MTPQLTRQSTYGCVDGREVIIGLVSVRTPLGFDAPSSAAAVRGGISAVAAHPVFVDKAGEPMQFARDPGLPPEMPFARRIECLLTSALAGARIGEHTRSANLRVECWVCLPEPRPGVMPEIAESIGVVAAAELRLPLSAVHVVQYGHAAGLMAIQLAAQKLSQGGVDICVVAGVDSYHDPDTLEWLDGNGLLMSSENRNGFVPGEAAAACVMASHHVTAGFGLPRLAGVIAASTSIEPNVIRGSDVCVGQGLTAVLQNVSSFLRLPEQAVTSTYCDLNGERYRSEEFTYTLLRVQDSFVNAHDYMCPADCWGDVGAASGILFLALAVLSHQRGYSEGLYPVLWAGSESGYRAAVALNL